MARLNKKDSTEKQIKQIAKQLKANGAIISEIAEDLKNKKGKKSQVVVKLPRDEQISPVPASAQGGPLIPMPAAQPVVQAPAPAPKPTLSAAERAVMSEGAPLARDRKAREANVGSRARSSL